MRSQIADHPPRIGFQIIARAATFEIGKERAMHPDDDPTDAAEADATKPVSERPRAAAWFWRPWYAKLWWAAIAVYWSGKLVSYWSSALNDLYTTALGGFLNIALYPPVALMVLGVGFGRAWFAWSDWELVEPSHEQMFPKKSVGGWRDPYTDPLDPRSGPMHWRRFSSRK